VPPVARRTVTTYSCSRDLGDRPARVARGLKRSSNAIGVTGVRGMSNALLETRGSSHSRVADPGDQPFVVWTATLRVHGASAWGSRPELSAGASGRVPGARGRRRRVRMQPVDRVCVLSPRKRLPSTVKPRADSRPGNRQAVRGRRTWRSRAHRLCASSRPEGGLGALIPRGIRPRCSRASRPIMRLPQLKPQGLAHLRQPLGLRPAQARRTVLVASAMGGKSSADSAGREYFCCPGCGM
jgi:hypothetical protein